MIAPDLDLTPADRMYLAKQLVVLLREVAAELKQKGWDPANRPIGADWPSRAVEGAELLRAKPGCAAIARRTLVPQQRAVVIERALGLYRPANEHEADFVKGVAEQALA